MFTKKNIFLQDPTTFTWTSYIIQWKQPLYHVTHKHYRILLRISVETFFVVEMKFIDQQKKKLVTKIVGNSWEDIELFKRKKHGK